MIKTVDLEKLSLKLKEKLPGQEAQYLMAPPGRSKFIMNKASIKIGGVLILFYKKENELYIPLMLRPNYSGVHSGQVSFPGGKQEDTDADLVQTALREAYEEVGIRQENVKILGTLSELDIPASNFRILPVVGFLASSPEFIANRYEVEEIIEAKLAWFFDSSKIKQTQIRLFNGVEVEAPYYEIGKHKVWGATAMIISELLEVLKGVNGQYH